MYLLFVMVWSVLLSYMLNVNLEYGKSSTWRSWGPHLVPRGGPEVPRCGPEDRGPGNRVPAEAA